MQVRIFFVDGYEQELVEFDNNTLSLKHLEGTEYLTTSQDIQFHLLFDKNGIKAMKWYYSYVGPTNIYLLFYIPERDHIQTFLMQDKNREWIKPLHTGKYIPEEVLRHMDSNLAIHLLSPHKLIRESAEQCIKDSN